MEVKVFDNYLDNEDFEFLENLKLKKINKDEMVIYHNKIVGSQVLSKSCLPDEFLIKINKRYHEDAIKLLEKLFPEKKNLYDFSEFHIIQTGSDYNFPIHDDTPDKLLSGVVYLSPEKNKGTIFYKDKKGSERNEIIWKRNRAVFFSRLERNSWHSFEGDKISTRIALVYNLKTKNIKGVYKAENKNYIIGYLRFKINPFLLKYFKITI